MGASNDVVGEVARGIYSQILSCQDGPKVWFDALPAEARSFIRAQARAGLERLRRNVTDGMVAAGAELGSHPHEVFCAMLDWALAKDMN